MPPGTLLVNDVIGLVVTLIYRFDLSAIDNNERAYFGKAHNRTGHISNIE